MSGFKVVETPGFDRALATIVDRRADILMSFKVERLTRQGIERVGPLLGTFRRADRVLFSCTTRSTPARRSERGFSGSSRARRSKSLRTSP